MPKANLRNGAGVRLAVRDRQLRIRPDAPTPWEQPFKEAKTAVTDAFEKRYLQRLLERSQNNLSRAATMAQVDRKHLRELLRKHGLWSGPDEG